MVGYPPSSTGGYRMELTDEQWAVIEPLIPEAERAPSGPSARGALPVRSSMASSGSCGRVPAGKTCRTAIRRTKPVIGASNSGSTAASSITCCRPSPRISWNVADSTCPNVSSMAPSWSPKKGRQPGSDQAGEGDEDHGHGRPRWASARRPHWVCCTT